jgi:hypothetical protein
VKTKGTSDDADWRKGMREPKKQSPKASTCLEPVKIKFYPCDNCRQAFTSSEELMKHQEEERSVDRREYSFVQSRQRSRQVPSKQRIEPNSLSENNPATRSIVANQTLFQPPNLKRRIVPASSTLTPPTPHRSKSEDSNDMMGLNIQVSHKVICKKGETINAGTSTCSDTNAGIATKAKDGLETETKKESTSSTNSSSRKPRRTSSCRDVEVCSEDSSTLFEEEEHPLLRDPVTKGKFEAFFAEKMRKIGLKGRRCE